MTLAIAPDALDEMFWLDVDLDDFSVGNELPAHLAEAEHGSWLWCFHCEHAFQVQGKVACPTAGCGGSPRDLWQWDAYRAVAGAEVAPVEQTRFPLAA